MRLALDGWRFGDAEARIQEATDVVRQRDETASQATAAGLSEPDGLETAYESADTASELADASALAANTQASLSAVIAAGAAAAAPRDWVTTLGLSGKDPDADLAAARSAWEAGQPDRGQRPGGARRGHAEHRGRGGPRPRDRHRRRGDAGRAPPPGAADRGDRALARPIATGAAWRPSP